MSPLSALPERPLLGLPQRLKRLGERLGQDAGTLYREHAMPFEPRWFLVFEDLSRTGPASATEVAGRIGVTHTAVIQALRELEAAELVAEAAQGSDRRKRLFELSPEGRRLHHRMQHLWVDQHTALAQVLEEAGGGFLQALGRLEAALDRLPVRERLPKCQTLRMLDALDVVRWSPALDADWHSVLQAAPEGLAFLTAPERELLHREDGKVERLLACRDTQVEGCAALLLRPRMDPLLLFLAVLPDARRRRVGRKLALAAIEQARDRGAKALLARSGQSLEGATPFYRSLGFAYAGPDGPEGGVAFRLSLKQQPV